jgi:hypothetical protein
LKVSSRLTSGVTADTTADVAARDTTMDWEERKVWQQAREPAGGGSGGRGVEYGQTDRQAGRWSVWL